MALPRRQSRRRHPDHDRVVAGEHDIDNDDRYQRAQLGHIQQHARDISMERSSVEGTG